MSQGNDIKKINASTKVRGVSTFVGLVIYYRDMWCKRAHTLAPLTKYFSTKVKYEWTDVEQKSFMEMNKILGRYVLLSYPNFSKILIVHTDARKM